MNDGGAWAGRGREGPRGGGEREEKGRERSSSLYGTREGQSQYFFSAPFLHGAVKNSAASLVVLLLSGYQGFDFQSYFDPLVPRFERLRVVDFSFCTGVKDER